MSQGYITKEGKSPLCFYNNLLISVSKVFLGPTPTYLVLSYPALKNNTVGMFLMLNLLADLGFSSTLHETTFILSP